ncbi:MAG: CRISPR-associated protein Cas4 [Acidilobaceae archaeon]|nr:CRISPR-associated protein Cas4 [Acidilobaceae archaeon]
MGSSLSNYLSASLVKEYSYCPTLPWLMANYEAYEQPTPSMEEGKRRALDKRAVAEELKLEQPWRFEVALASKRLGLKGVVDIVAGSRSYTVVELKAFERNLKRSHHFRDQLLIYALLVNDVLGPVRRAVLYLGKRALDMPVGERELSRARELIERTRRAVSSPEPPRGTPSPGKCLYCSFRRLCPYSP